jgi:hypothetical protein
MLKKQEGREGTGFIWLMIGTNGRLLWTGKWSFGLHRMWGITGVAEELLASQEGLCSLELVNPLAFSWRHWENPRKTSINCSPHWVLNPVVPRYEAVTLTRRSGVLILYCCHTTAFRSVRLYIILCFLCFVMSLLNFKG